MQALPAFRGECAPWGYACRIAFRTALAMRKRSHTRRARHDTTLDTDSLPDSESPNALTDARRRTELVRSLLDDIPTEQAEALAMRTMLGWSIEEIAAASGPPINTVRSRLPLSQEAQRRDIDADRSVGDAPGVRR